jgi:CxxC-x17-CxxC domain-containing protein
MNSMTSFPPSSPSNSTRTNVTCTQCGKATTVPFVPTPGRPVLCRDCFAKKPASAPRGFDARSTPGGERAPRAPVEGQRKRMMAQGRKTHFLYDAKAALASIPGGMELKDNRAFLEGLFARGARGSTDDAQIFLEEKVKDGAVTHEQAILLGRLIDKYSFVR